MPECLDKECHLNGTWDVLLQCAKYGVSFQHQHEQGLTNLRRIKLLVSRASY
jgi:hypothetical protein